MFKEYKTRYLGDLGFLKISLLKNIKVIVCLIVICIIVICIIVICITIIVS
jgi:hypothetical protein